MPPLIGKHDIDSSQDDIALSYNFSTNRYIGVPVSQTPNKQPQLATSIFVAYEVAYVSGYHKGV